MKNKLTKILIIVVVSSLVMLQVSSIVIYEVIFGRKIITDELLISNMDDYENLERTRFEFNTRFDNKLVGYLYETKDVEEKGLVVFAHGFGGGGQRGYLEIFNFLSSSGYYVFAYDATANDESEGKVVGGLPQGIIDLDYAINFTKTLDKVKDLPLFLMGFSWGAFSVSNVLNYQDDVEAVVAIAGWNESINLVEYYSVQNAGEFTRVALPFIRLYETIKYGKYASSKAMNGFEKTNAKIMIVHSEDDDTVPIEYGYYKYLEKYGNNDRFSFKHYDHRGHGNVYYNEESVRYLNGFKNQLNTYKKVNNPTDEELLNYIDKNLDRNKIANMLDYDLFNEILELYNSCL